MKSWPCKTCGVPVHSLRVHGRWEADPYCSAVCARRDHGLPEHVASVSMDHSTVGKHRDPMLRP